MELKHKERVNGYFTESSTKWQPPAQDNKPNNVIAQSKRRKSLGRPRSQLTLIAGIT